MGMHVGEPRRVCDPMSRRVEYIGPTINTAARITTMAHGNIIKFINFLSHSKSSLFHLLIGGQILISGQAYSKLKGTDISKEKTRFVYLGKFEMPDYLSSKNYCLSVFETKC